jgi:hypothetical protein
LQGVSRFLVIPVAGEQLRLSIFDITSAMFVFWPIGNWNIRPRNWLETLDLKMLFDTIDSCKSREKRDETTKTQKKNKLPGAYAVQASWE